MKRLSVALFLAFSFITDFVVQSKEKSGDVVYAWQDIQISSQDFEEPELMQQPSPNSGAQLNSMMENI